MACGSVKGARPADMYLGIYIWVYLSMCVSLTDARDSLALLHAVGGREDETPIAGNLAEVSRFAVATHTHSRAYPRFLSKFHRSGNTLSSSTLLKTRLDRRTVSASSPGIFNGFFNGFFNGRGL